MMEIGYGRIRDIGGLPDLLRAEAGEEGLSRAFRDQDLPLSLLQLPDQLVPIKDLVGLYQHAAIITGVRSFGLEASKTIDLSEHGPVGQYIVQGATLKDALFRFRIALPYHESGSSFFIEDGGDTYRLCYRNVHQHLVGWRHAGDFTFAAIGSILDHYLGAEWQPMQIETCYPPGNWMQDLEDFYKAPIVTGCDEIAMVIAKDLVGVANPSTAGLKDNKDNIVCLTDILNFGRTIPHRFADILINILDRQIADRSVSLDHTAALLGLSTRTLQRRLGEQNLSFRNLAAHREMCRASELLADNQLTVAQVAQQVGYSHASQFIRAFKKVFGMTPDAFRRRSE